MATAQPIPESGRPWTITISPDGTVAPDDKYLKIGSFDTIAFHNTASYAVNVTFTSQFDPISGLQPDLTSDPLGGTVELNVTLNFTIFNASTGEPTGGPYAVQFGIGALRITLTGSVPTPPPASIPKGGQIQFDNRNPSTTFDIAWDIAGNPVTAWTPQPPTVPPGVNPTQAALTVTTGRTVRYKLSVQGAARGGGTVIVGS